MGWSEESTIPYTFLTQLSQVMKMCSHKALKG